MATFDCHDESTGTLKFSAQMENWVGEAKSRLFLLVADNLKRVNRVAVELFTSDGRKIAAVRANLSRRSRAQKLSNLPEISDTMRFKMLVWQYL